MDSAKLLPCPFCGGDAETESQGIDNVTFCSDCGAYPGSAFARTPEESRQGWNARSRFTNDEHPRLKGQRCVEIMEEKHEDFLDG